MQLKGERIINLFGANWSFGQKLIGVDQTPKIMRELGIAKDLSKIGF